MENMERNMYKIWIETWAGDFPIKNPVGATCIVNCISVTQKDKSGFGLSLDELSSFHPHRHQRRQSIRATPLGTAPASFAAQGTTNEFS